MVVYTKADVQRALRSSATFVDVYAVVMGRFHQVRGDVAAIVRSNGTSQIPVTGSEAKRLLPLFEHDDAYTDVYEKLYARAFEISPKQNSVEAKRWKQALRRLQNEDDEAA